MAFSFFEIVLLASPASLKLAHSTLCVLLRHPDQTLAPVVISICQILLFTHWLNKARPFFFDPSVQSLYVWEQLKIKLSSEFLNFWTTHSCRNLSWGEKNHDRNKLRPKFRGWKETPQVPAVGPCSWTAAKVDQKRRLAAQRQRSRGVNRAYPTWTGRSTLVFKTPAVSNKWRICLTYCLGWSIKIRSYITTYSNYTCMKSSHCVQRGSSHSQQQLFSKSSKTSRYSPWESPKTELKRTMNIRLIFCRWLKRIAGCKNIWTSLSLKRSYLSAFDPSSTKEQ